MNDSNEIKDVLNKCTVACSPGKKLLAGRRMGGSLEARSVLGDGGGELWTVRRCYADGERTIAGAVTVWLLRRRSTKTTGVGENG